jgi:hypothetical protein
VMSAGGSGISTDSSSRYRVVHLKTINTYKLYGWLLPTHMDLLGSGLTI